MSSSVHVVNWVLRRFFQAICRIDTQELNKVPLKGPLIIVGNHINFLEVPVVFPHLDPRPLTALAKRESWKNPLFHFLFNQWGIIPIDRGMVDRDAFRLSFEALEQGKILAISPEGTRSMDGKLQQGKPGVVALALRSGAPLMPIGFYGYEKFWPNLKRLRRSDFHVRLGKPFHLTRAGDALDRDARQAMTDEIMYKIAELLPEQNRGVYSGKVAYRYIVEDEA